MDKNNSVVGKFFKILLFDFLKNSQNLYVQELFINNMEIVNDNSELKTTPTNTPNLSRDILIESLLSTCNIEHISNCSCQRSNVDSKYKELFEQEMNDLIKRGSETNNSLVEARREYAKDKAVKLVADYCKNNSIKCPIERAKVIQHLTFFESKYDLSDPRVFVIVESLLHQMLSAHRFQQYSNEHGVLNIWYDKQDNKRISLNPVEQIKLDYDRARIDAISVLDKIMEGEKINVNMKTIDIDDVFKNVDLRPGQYRVLE